ncbi:MAG: hypothetical protein JJE17_01640 [Peptostreptococcaceae bacterium]|nr:hypothetical protein [Peptostreptococcaceae bacterium]
MEWNFPGNGNGQIRGFSDAGIETYGGNELQALARETCQNSLDAIRDNETEVRVEFERHYINANEMPGHEDYAKILKKCQVFWSESKSEKAIAYLKTAVKAINENKLYVLRISDYNTTGLLGPYDDRFDGWNALTKIDGGATKSGDKAGSFGIGKNAPFCNSYYRLVFYRTLNDEGEKAAQGISRLLSFPEDSNNANAMNSMTTGIGYFGNSTNNRPVVSIPSLDSLSVREEKGTDVFVYGFSVIGSGWIDDMCVEILENFMMSIYNGKLSVKIQNFHLNSNTLGAYMEKYRSKLKQAYCFYLALARANDVVERVKDFHGLGTLKLRVLVDQNEKLNKKIMITRTSGMKLFTLGYISRAISFSGILEMRGGKLNEYFREMETPAHDKWLPSRHHNPAEAKEYFDELKEWIREIVLSLGEYSSDEEIEVEGLSGILQNESELARKQSEDDKKETLNNNLGTVMVTPRASQEKTTKGLFFGSDGVGQAETTDVPGTVNPGGREPTTRKLGGTRTRTKRDPHVGLPNPDGNDTVHKSSGGEKNCPLENVRIVKISNNSFRVSFSLPHSILSGHAEILAVGENGKSSRLKILAADALSGCMDIRVANQKINFSSMSGNDKVSFKFSIMDNKEYAMEVNVYEHN